MSYVFAQTLPATSFTNVSTAQTFTVAMGSWDTLILDVSFTRAAGTATVFTFTGKTQGDSSSDYGLTLTNYAAGTCTDATFTYTSSSTYKKRFIFSLTGVGEQGTVTVGIAVTAGTTDAITVTPTVARTA